MFILKYTCFIYKNINDEHSTKHPSLETIGQFYSNFDTIIFSNILHKIYLKIHLQTIELQQKI